MDGTHDASVKINPCCISSPVISNTAHERFRILNLRIYWKVTCIIEALQILYVHHGKDEKETLYYNPCKNITCTWFMNFNKLKRGTSPQMKAMPRNQYTSRQRRTLLCGYNHRPIQFNMRILPRTTRNRSWTECRLLKSRKRRTIYPLPPCRDKANWPDIGMSTLSA